MASSRLGLRRDRLTAHLAAPGDEIAEPVGHEVTALDVEKNPIDQGGTSRTAAGLADRVVDVMAGDLVTENDASPFE